MKKRIIPALLLALLLLVTASCNQIKDIIGGASGGSLSQDEIYRNLDMLVSSPSSQTNNPINGKTITFTAYIHTEPFEESFEEEDGDYRYQVADISRSVDSANGFYLEVSDIAETPAVGDIVVVTGKINGTVFWTEDGERVEVLDVKASKIEPLTASEPTADTTSPFDYSNWLSAGTYTVKGAHYVEDVFGDKYVAVYVDFKNTYTKDCAPQFSEFYYYYGEAQADFKYNLSGADGIDPAALDATSLFPDDTYKDKSQLYWFAIEVPEDAEEAGTVWICAENDDFYTIIDVEVPIAESFEAMNG
ncbi:MAG: hypothetical protein LBC78_01805 [Oscillospiraceae bacterium]|jgi:hypothetical protein|nr:hypothetical protein [Oscillospiraceae bacterium]